MPQLLTLSRAARLIGITRGALQKHIKNGDLETFDGMVSIDNLQAVYPDVKFAEDLVLERINQIKEESFAKRVRERVLPDKEVLAARLYEQSRELADVRNHLQRYHSILVQAQHRLQEISNSGSGRIHPSIGALDDWLNQQLQEALNTEAPDTLTIMDDYLRVVSASVVLQPSRHEFFVDGADTILEAALRSGLALNYGCSNGNCGLCKARIVSGQTKKVRHHDYVLSEAEKNSGYTLLCSHAPVTDLVIEALEALRPSDIPVQEVQTRVKAIEPLTDKVMRLHLQTPRTNRLRFLAGQNVWLSTSESSPVEYAIASCPCDDRNLEFHVRAIPGNDFAARVFGGLKNGDAVTLQGPQGNFVLQEESTRSPLFIACNSGFAPIKSLIEHAMALDTVAGIHLFWLATFPTGHYRSNLCRSWADALDNFFYTELAADTLEGENIPQSLQKLLEKHPDLSGFDIYLSGPEIFVAKAREWLSRHSFPETQLVSSVV